MYSGAARDYLTVSGELEWVGAKHTLGFAEW